MFIASVSGNSGCGKSTLLKALCSALKQRHDIDAVVFDESRFHHELLTRMFEQPHTWALPIQINFLLQRAIALLRLQETQPRGLLLMERSIEEDELFFSYYLERGDIEARMLEPYAQLQWQFRSRLPPVACNIYLHGELPTLQARIEQDVAAGRRPPELTGSQLRSYLEAIERIYRAWAERKRRSTGPASLWIEGDGVLDVPSVATTVARAYRECRHA